jgi:uncharacterized protein (DUF433 family)
MNLDDQLKTLRRNKPFEPFRLVATDGRSIDVTRALMFGFNGNRVLVAKDTGGSWEAKYSEIAVIEPLKASEQNLTPQLLNRITVDPAQCGGKPCIRGMRIRVADVLELLAADMSHEQILAQMPDLEEDDIRASLAYAVRCTEQTRRSA